MDLADIQFADSNRMNITHPTTGEPLLDGNGDQMYVEIKGTYSNEYRKKQMEITDRRLKKRKMRMSAQELDTESRELMISVLSGWHIFFNGEFLEFKLKNVRQILTDPKFRWLVDQIDEYMGDESNFLLNSSTNADSGESGASD